MKPTYTGGADHQSLYTYTAVAYNAFCDNTRAYTVQVLVDEPLKGNIEGESEICEGESTFFDASSYEATYYNWHPDSLSLAPTPMLQVQPIVSTDYVVDMSRGLCAARDTFTVTVHTNPVIQSIDSVGLRDRQIMLVGGLGTAPFTYAIDAFEADNNDVKKDLTFSKHVVYVYDVYGCTTSETFRLSPPSLDIPVLFTPNGDGNEDNWIVANLTEVYPNAVVRIYDRFGKLIAQFLGADADGWDGTYRGAALPSTDYWYQITIEEIDQEYVGHFTLIRR